MKRKGTKSLLIGSLVASLLASACCIGPILFAIVGISSAGLLSRFEPYRGMLIIIALLMLSLSALLIFRKKASVDCKEGSFCANPKSKLWNNSILYIAIVVVIGILTFPEWSSTNSPSSSKDIEIKNEVAKEYYVKGMTCGGCIIHVNTALARDFKRISYQDKKIGVGTLKLTFKSGSYKNNETDCAIKHSIESQTEYIVYYDQQYKKAVCPESNKVKI